MNLNIIYFETTYRKLKVMDDTGMCVRRFENTAAGGGMLGKKLFLRK